MARRDVVAYRYVPSHMVRYRPLQAVTGRYRPLQAVTPRCRPRPEEAPQPHILSVLRDYLADEFTSADLLAPSAIVLRQQVAVTCRYIV